ncbi:MAG: glycosyltransferase family 4 protein, partial [Desulfobacterales bacterium]|nr:glycosyltransferase family 4 protein [Desulfobacterales bacterium]
HLQRSMESGSVRLLVVGKGNIRKYQEMADSLGIGDRVVFTGPVENDIERIYLGSDVFILLSKFDTFAMVVLEAMAAGLPVIISPTVGARDVVCHGENGYVVDPIKSDEVSHHIEQILRSKHYETMAENARKTAALYSWTALAQKVTRLYCQVLNSTAENDPTKEVS